MRPPRFFVSLLVTGVLLRPNVAQADLPTPRLLPEFAPAKDQAADSATEPDPWTTRKRTVSLQGGAPGGPTGIAGFTFEYAPIKNLVLGTGAGWSPEGVRGAFLPRLRLPLNRRFAVGMGLPLSFGPYEFTESLRQQCDYVGCGVGFRTTRTWPLAFWGHLEPNVEIRLNGGLALRLYGGYSRVLNDQSDHCVSTLANGCPSSIGEQRWYGGLALGYAW
jgi:hypothetical protein